MVKNLTTSRFHSSLRRLSCLLVLSAALWGVTACSQGDDSGKEEVASLPTPQGDGTAGKPSAGPSGASEAGRPHIRMDTSDEDGDAIWQAWYKCFKDHGGVVHPVPEEKVRKKGMITADAAEQPAAVVKACAHKEPVTPWQLDRDRNPEYADDFRDWVKCIEGKGLPIDPLPNAEGWNYDDSVSQDERASARTQEIVDSCEMEAFK